MKKIVTIIAVACLFVAAAEQKPVAESRVRIGIMDLDCYNDAKKIVESAQFELLTLVKDVGFYDCFDQSQITKKLAETEDRIPPRCREPKCVLEVGRLSNMDRMIFGTLEWGNEICAVKLTMIDVLTRQTIETVSIEGTKGVKAAEVLRVAVAKLHGRDVPASSFSTYYGPRVHNEKQLLYTSAACLGLGMLYGAVNYGVEQKVDKVESDYRDGPLSGIATTGNALFARPAALANAYVAVSDDAYGVLYNPAGMAWVAGPQAVLGYQYRFGLDNMAATYVNKATREIGFGQAILYRADREQLMRELYFVSAAAYKFNNVPNVRPFSVGANVKVAGTRIKSTSEFSSGGNSLGIGIDAGCLIELSEEIRYGLMLRDLPILNSYKNVKTGESYFESEPVSLLMGGTFKAGYTTLLVAEGQIPIYKDQAWKMAGAIEQELFKILCFRIGIKREIMAAYETPWLITTGFGMKVTTDQETGRYISLDGSYEYNSLQVFDVMNVSMRFGF